MLELVQNIGHFYLFIIYCYFTLFLFIFWAASGGDFCSNQRVCLKDLNIRLVICTFWNWF